MSGEQLTILEDNFPLSDGRLFLVDLQIASPIVMQTKVDLPSGLELTSTADEHLLELADKTLEGLLKNDVVKTFFKDRQK